MYVGAQQSPLPHVGDLKIDPCNILPMWVCITYFAFKGMVQMIVPSKWVGGLAGRHQIVPEHSYHIHSSKRRKRSQARGQMEQSHLVVLPWPDVTGHESGAEPFLFNSTSAKLARRQLNIQLGHVS